jgi:hypothetical protein
MQIINVNKVKAEIDKACRHYKNNVQLYSIFSTEYADFPEKYADSPEKFGLIFLSNYDYNDNYFYSDCLRLLRSLTFSLNHNYIHKTLSALATRGSYIIKPFDGELPSFPYSCEYDFVPHNNEEIFYRVIDYVAAGCTPSFNMNPNLISSLGYSFDYEKI